jgi:hypothetical protein
MSNEIEVQFWNGNILGWSKRKIVLNEKEKEIVIKKESANFTENFQIKFKMNNIEIRKILNEKNDEIFLIETISNKYYIKFNKNDEKEKLVSFLKKNKEKQNIYSMEFKKIKMEIEQNNKNDNINIKNVIENDLKLFENYFFETEKKIENIDKETNNKKKNYQLFYENIKIINNDFSHDFYEFKKHLNIYLNSISLLSSEKKENTNLSKIEEFFPIKTISRKYSIVSSVIENKNDFLNFISTFSSKFIDLNSNNFEVRTQLPSKITQNQNMLSELITVITKKTALPIYFNEPISMLQKQCEKFFFPFLDKACDNDDIYKQYINISNFIFSEIFINLNRTLKPFNPIIGETFEFFNKNFKYFAEQISHNPPISAYYCENNNFICFTDTNSKNNFKFFKGCYELNFFTKFQIYIKKFNNFFWFNLPNLNMKGIISKKLYNDYSGKVVIQNHLFNNVKCEIDFDDFDIDGRIYEIINEEEKTIYEIKGNLKKEINYLKNEEIVETLKNDFNVEKDEYFFPEFSCQLNDLNENDNNMKNLPKFDSRFRPDMREYEKGNVKEAQEIKFKLEQKQRDKLKDFVFVPKYFEKKFNDIINEEVFIYNGKYYDDKINNTFNLKNDFQDNDIFNI